jgi:hypothetical protein
LGAQGGKRLAVGIEEQPGALHVEQAA